ncbi:hypothetical protein [uncultured Sulfitobacter sp.]|uniref:hypothetical protein n=1 Tax=uncultured Sulfitobacter sp. TaxID=191468 RepID=UPI002622B959|nr:hypothetical protein [uncultured Sulfitobacter sp.]
MFMTFAETYREERLINRRSRARKARIAGRIIGFGLMACLVVALRTDPQLRSLVENAAFWVIGATDPRTQGEAAPQTDAIDALGYAEGSEEAKILKQMGIRDTAASAGPAQSAPVTSQMPQSRVKINRPISD